MLGPPKERPRCHQGYAKIIVSKTPYQCPNFSLISGRPCKIVDMSTSKTGKHGHAKVHLVAIDVRYHIFNAPDRSSLDPEYQ